MSQALLSWQTIIYIVPVKSGKPELWADSGYVTIEGELIYYSSVTRVSGAVTQFNSCIRRVNGTPPRNNPIGTSVRGFVIAEHHNNLARALVNIESFIGITDSTDKESIVWKLNYINSLLPYTDDAGCPQLEFWYRIVSEDPIRGTEIFYNLTINSTQPYTGFTINFGDGTTENELLSGTHYYSPNKKIEPVATVDSPSCQGIQTSAQSISLDDLQQVDLITINNQPIIVPTIPDFPNFSLATVNDVPDAIQFPPIVFPCLDIGPFGPIVIPSSISLINANVIPSVISFNNVPTFPSSIVITSDLNIPSTIQILSDIPTSITVSDTIPSIIDVNTNIPSIINVNSPSNISISLITPSVINLSPSVIQVQSNIPSVITVNDIDIAVSLTSDYCTNCTGNIQTNAPNTAGGPTDAGCNACAGANQKISKVTVVLHDFMVQTFNAPEPYTRYDLVKVLVVDPNGNTCLIMGGASADATSIPQFIMGEPVTLTFDDASTNNIYDFSKPLQSGTYAPNANGNTLSRSAGQVNIGTPAPAPSGFNGYGSNLSVFNDQPLVAGAWNVYAAVGPVAPTYQNLVYIGSACARVNSNGESPCDFATPTPTPSGMTPKPSKTPAPTPRRTNAPTPTPRPSRPPGTPQPTPNRTPLPTQFGPGGQPWPGTGGGGFGGGGGGGAGIIIPVDPGRPIPAPSKTPKPTPPPTPLPNCGSCDFRPSLQNCGSGVCTYYWNFTSKSWSRCADCQSCSVPGGNCNCPEARWLVSFGILPVDGTKNPTINTNCFEFVWTNNTLSTCDGFCTYAFDTVSGTWQYYPNDSYCPGTSGCECQSPETLVQKGILSKNPGTNKTQHTKCYTSTPISKCAQGCECPPAPTLQAITSTSQTISLSCKPECGTCIDEYITDFNNPCDPDPTDYTCVYEYTSTFGWRIEPVSHCGCDNMDCLSADAAKNAGLFPDSPSQGELVYLSCYGGSWYNYNFCNPDADCKCPPTPTPPPAGQQPGNSFLVNQCVNPTPTPSPTVGCGDCIFEFDAPVCGSGNCVYTYYSDLLEWTVGSNCGSSLCNCMNVEDAQFMGLLPDNPLDGEQVTSSCYFYSSSQQALEGTWNFTGDTCSVDCTCLNTQSYSGYGFFPGQIKINDCVPKPSPTPTPSASGPQPSPLPTPNTTIGCNFVNCSYYWAGTGCSTSSTSQNCYYQFDTLSNQWQFITGLCTGGCTCPSVAQLQKTISNLTPGTLDFSTGCISTNPTDGSWVLYENSCGPTCSCPQVYGGSILDYGFRRTVNCENSCSGCVYKWNGSQYVVVAGNCSFPCLPSGCKTPPTTYSTDTITLPCGYEACSGGCTFTCTLTNGSYKWVPAGLCIQADANCACYPLSASSTCNSSTVGAVVNSSCSLPNNGCIGNCYFTWDAASKTWVYDSGSSQPCIQYGVSAMFYENEYDMDFSSYESEEILMPQALSCGCIPPFFDGTTNGTKTLGTCGPILNPVSLIYSQSTNITTSKPVNALINLTPTATPYIEHTPAPTPPPSITPIDSDILTSNEVLRTTIAQISKDRVKLCQYAGKEPLKMINQGCGTCAIRRCEKFGLCSHTSVVEGHPEVICCQQCTAYSSDKLGTIKLSPQKNSPSSHSVYNSNINRIAKPLEPIQKELLASSEVEQIHDPVTMAENITNDGSMVKVVPKDAVINVNVDELVRGREKNEKD